MYVGTIVDTVSTRPFELDEAKNAANVAKHGISFEQAAAIFDGPVVSHTDRRKDYGETRTVTYGALGEQVVVAVVHTDRQAITRIISARLASARERGNYYVAL